jgi:hypothetical protein
MSVKKLSAEVSVEDKASKTLERITKNVQKQNNELIRLKTSMVKLREQSRRKSVVKVETTGAVKSVERLKRTLDNVQYAAKRTKNALSGLGSGLARLNPGLLAGGLAAVGGGYLGKQVFDSTFGQAANYEMSTKVIQAMFNDKKKSEQYVKAMEQMAIGSPLLNSQNIFANSKSFIALSKNQIQLEKMWDLTERLLAVDPAQGVEGAVFALRELFSGDAKSMAERFEMPKSALNEIKNLPIEKQIVKLDELFNKMGMTKSLVNEMGDTTLGVWNQIKETTAIALRQIGDPAVKIIKPFLDDANRALQSGKLNPYIEFGKDMASGIAKGFIKVSRGVGKWIDDIVNDPEFQKLDTIEGKFTRVLEIVETTFNNWYEKDGAVILEKIGTGLVDSLILGIENNLPRIVEMGLKLGGSLTKGIVSSLDKWAGENPGYATLLGIGGGFAAGGVWGAAGLGGAAFATSGYENVKQEGMDSPFIPKFNMPIPSLNFMIPKSNDLNYLIPRAVGSKRIPRNNYPALLHEGEQVLTKQEVNSQSNTESSPISITIQKMNVREESDIKKIASELVKELERVRLNFGGA